MKLWSKGLGKMTLPLALHTAELEPGADTLRFRGRIIEGKVNWNYLVSMDASDMLGFTRVVGGPEVLDYLARQKGLRLFVDLALPLPRFLWELLVSILRPRRLPDYQPRAGEPRRLQRVG